MTNIKHNTTPKESPKMSHTSTIQKTLNQFSILTPQPHETLEKINWILKNKNSGRPFEAINMILTQTTTGPNAQAATIHLFTALNMKSYIPNNLQS